MKACAVIAVAVLLASNAFAEYLSPEQRLARDRFIEDLARQIVTEQRQQAEAAERERQRAEQERAQREAQQRAWAEANAPMTPRRQLLEFQRRDLEMQERVMELRRRDEALRAQRDQLDALARQRREADAAAREERERQEAARRDALRQRSDTDAQARRAAAKQTAQQAQAQQITAEQLAAGEWWRVTYDDGFQELVKSPGREHDAEHYVFMGDDDKEFYVLKSGVRKVERVTPAPAPGPTLTPWSGSPSIRWNPAPTQ